MRHFTSPLRALLATALLTAMLVDGCRCDKAEEAPPPPKFEGDLVRRRVPDTNLVVAIPKGWQLEMPDPGPLPPPPPPNTPITLNTRMLVSARPGLPAPGMLVAPWLQILEDPWLPVGTTGVDYLVAQRSSNQLALHTNIRHVDAEPSRRQGRPSYHIRDEWNVQAPDGRDRVMSQEALLILESATSASGVIGVHGYTVLITLEKGEFESMQPLVRAILESVVFEEKTPGAGVAGGAPPR